MSEWSRLKKEASEVIRKELSLKRSATSKTSFPLIIQQEMNVLQPCMRKTVEYLKAAIDKYIPGDIDKFQKSKYRGLLRKETIISENRYAANRKKQKLEDTLERTIVVAMDDGKVYNQFNLLSGINNSQNEGGRISIDLVDLRKENVCRMIELKAWNNTNENPISPAIELLSYYFAYMKMIKIEEDNFKDFGSYELVVLAPENYYSYYLPDYKKRLNQIAHYINVVLKFDLKIANVNFSFQILGLQLNTFLDVIETIKPDSEVKIGEDSKQIIRNTYIEASNG